MIFDEDFIDTVVELHGRGDKTDVTHWLQVEMGRSLLFAEDIRAFNPVPVQKSLRLLLKTQTCSTLCIRLVLQGYQRRGHTHDSSIWALVTFMATGDLQMVDRTWLVCRCSCRRVPLALNVYRGTCSIVMRSFDPVRPELIEQEKISTGFVSLQC